MMSLVINGSPSSWGNLYSALKEAEKFRRSIYTGGKTILSFYLHLYIKAARFQEKNDVKNGFLFRTGEL